MTMTHFLRAVVAQPAAAHSTNLQRALWADRAIGSFIACTGCELEDTLADLLCDLMHWATIVNLDYNEALQRARSHFESESRSDGCGS